MIKMQQFSFSSAAKPFYAKFQIKLLVDHLEFT